MISRACGNPGQGIIAGARITRSGKVDTSLPDVIN